MSYTPAASPPSGQRKKFTFEEQVSPKTGFDEYDEEIGSVENSSIADSEVQSGYAATTGGKREFPLEASEARAHAYAAELAAAKKAIERKDEKIAKLELDFKNASVEFRAMKEYNARLDSEDGGDRSSQASLLTELTKMSDALTAEREKGIRIVKASEKAKLGMNGLRSQLRIANDMLDWARMDNEALLEPLRLEIAELRQEGMRLEGLLSEAKQETSGARLDLAASREEERGARAAELKAREDFKRAEAGQLKAEQELREHKDSMAETIDYEVREGTRELATELDEAYERCDELRLQEKKLQEKITELKLAATTFTDALALKDSELAKLLGERDALARDLASATAEGDFLRTKVSNHDAVAEEVGDLMRERERRIAELETHASQASLDVKSLCAGQARDQEMTEHLQRIIKARNEDLAARKSELSEVSAKAREALRRMKLAEASRAEALEECDSRAQATVRAERALEDTQQAAEKLQGELEEAYAELNKARGKGAKVLVNRATQTKTKVEQPRTPNSRAGRPGMPGGAAGPGGDVSRPGSVEDRASGDDGSAGGAVDPEGQLEEELEGSVSFAVTLRKGKGKSSADGRKEMVKLEKAAARMRERRRLEALAVAIQREVLGTQSSRASSWQNRHGRKRLIQQDEEKHRPSMNVRRDQWLTRGRDPKDSVYLPKLSTPHGGTGNTPAAAWRLQAEREAALAAKAEAERNAALEALESARTKRGSASALEALSSAGEPLSGGSTSPGLGSGDGRAPSAKVGLSPRQPVDL